MLRAGSQKCGDRLSPHFCPFGSRIREHRRFLPRLAKERKVSVDAKIQRELRLLKAYAAVSLLLFGGLIFIAAKNTTRRVKFEEIDVERINILEKDGKLRMTISNNQRSPGPVIGGVYMKRREGKRGAGMIFFNDKGDECGGMTWGIREEAGKIEAEAGLMFDQYNQDQTVGITYSQNNLERSSGLRVWERPLVPMAEFARQINDVELMKDSPAKNEAMKKLRETAASGGLGGAQRVFVGRTTGNEAVVSLADTKGKPRLLLSVDGTNAATLQFLDENGKVVYKIPDNAPGAGK